MSRYVKISVVAIGPIRMNQKPDNISMADYVLNLVRENIRPVLWDKPDLIVLPENCDMLYGGDPEECRRLCQQVGDRTLQLLIETAKTNHCYITYPSRIYFPDGSARNTVRMIDRSGHVIGVYHKNFTTIGETLFSGILCGRDIPVFSCDFGTVCPIVCFDLNFEENRNRIKALKPDITVFCSRFHGSFMENFFAYDTRSYFVSANCNLPSGIISPLGEQIAHTTNYFNYVTQEINLDYAVCHLDYNEEKLQTAKAKYGSSIKIHDPGLLGSILLTSETTKFSVQHVLQEFGIEELDDYMARARQHREQYLEPHGLEGVDLN